MRARDLVVLVAAAGSVALAVNRGLWQLDRAAQKIALQSALAARDALPALEAPTLGRTVVAAEAQHYRRIGVTGRWLGERTVFLDNRQMDGKVGFLVVTPLALEASAQAVLVQRGWAPRHFDDRTALPQVATPSGPVRVEGIVAPAPARLFEFAATASGPIRQNLDIGAYARETGLALLPLTIRQGEVAASPGDGLSRHWPAPTVDVQMHYGYAFQWFAIGAVIAFLYVWFRIVQPRRRRPA